MGKSKSGGGGGGPLSGEDVLTGVVIADTLSRHLHPLTLECPAALLPVANTPLVDHALSVLCLAGVQRCLVYTSRGVEELAAHVLRLRTGDDRLGLAGMEVVVRAYPPMARNAVDVLKDCYDLGGIESDFVLVTGPVVASFNLAPVIARHKERTRLHPDTLMTCVLRRCAPSNLSRGESEDLAVVIEPKTSRMLHYASMNRRGALRLDAELLAKCTASGGGPLEVRCDVLDTNIDVCSKNVLVQAIDNFDFQSVRGGLVANLHPHHPVVEHRFYAEILSETDYAAPVQDFKTYAAVTSNICKRWGSLVAPDANVHGGRSAYVYRAATHSFIDTDVEIARTSVVRNGCQIAAGTTVAERAVVEHSSVGRGVSIGPGATVRSSSLWAGVTVGEGAVIESSIVASGAVLGAGAQIGPGCVISFGVRIEAGAIIAPGKRLTLLTVEEAEAVDCREEDAVIIGGPHIPRPWIGDEECDADGVATAANASGTGGGTGSSSSRRPSRGARSSRVSDDPAAPMDVEELTGDAVGREKRPSTSSATSSSAASASLAAVAAAGSASGEQRAWREYDPLENCDVPSSDEEDDPFEDAACNDDPAAAEIAAIRADAITAQRLWCACGADHLVPDPAAPDDESDAGEGAGGATAEDHFVKEVRETIARGVNEDLLLSNVAMEIKSLRLSCDRSNAETARCVLEGLLELLDFGAGGINAEFARWKAMLAKWKTLLTAIMPADVMGDLLLLVVDFCDDFGAAGLKLFPAILLELYEHDIVSEDACFVWERESKADNDPDAQKFLAAAQGFLTWLREADEEDDSDEDDDDDDDDDTE
jgi:translation initiation factor eIF-2B subunit epsilon